MRQSAALDAHLERALAAAAFWGVNDCFLWPADWVVMSGHADPAAEWRGRYRTALGAARIASSWGGMVALWTLAAERAGLQRAAAFRCGDVGLVAREVISGPTLSGAAGAICLGGGEWALATPGGVRCGRFEPISAWRVPWLR